MHDALKPFMRNNTSSVCARKEFYGNKGLSAQYFEDPFIYSINSVKRILNG